MFLNSFGFIIHFRLRQRGCKQNFLKITSVNAFRDSSAK